MRRVAQRLALEVVGWTLLAAGVVALAAPGPGTLMIFGAMAILARQYEWAGRRLEPLKQRALTGAARNVETWPRIAASTLLAIGLICCGVAWVWSPSVPAWWGLPNRWWLPGGLAAGISFVVSGLVALGLITWSYRRFHRSGTPPAIEP